MSWSTPTTPVSGTVITVAWAQTSVVDPVSWLRLLTGNADPPGSNYVVVSTSTTATTWQKVGTDVIADSSVTSAKLAPGAVIAVSISDGNIGTAKLANLSITTAKIEDGAITSGKLGAGAVIAVAISDGNIGTAKLADSAVTAAKIADGNVTSSKMAVDSVNASAIADGNVGTAELANDAVTSAKIATSAVGTSEIADDSVTVAKIAANAVGTSELIDGGVTAAKLAAGAVAAVPSGLIAAFETAAAIASGWTRYTAADGRYLVGAGTAGSPTVSNPKTFTQATNYGTDWEHTHGVSGLGPAAGTTVGPSATTNVGSGGTAVASATHTHTYPVGTMAGALDSASWVIPSRAVVMAIKS